MNAPAVVEIVPPVAALAAEINAEHELAQQAAKTSMQHASTAVQHAARCGNLLLSVKASLKHGEFMPWIEQNCRFPQSTATLYMTAAKQIANGLAISTLRGLFPSGTEHNRAQGKIKITKTNTPVREIEDHAGHGDDVGHLRHREHVADADHGDDDGVQRPSGGARERLVGDAFGDINVTKPLRQPPSLFRQNSPTPLRHLLSAWDAASVETRKRLFRTRPKEIQETIDAANAEEGLSRRGVR